VPQVIITPEFYRRVLRPIIRPRRLRGRRAELRQGAIQETPRAHSHLAFGELSRFPPCVRRAAILGAFLGALAHVSSRLGEGERTGRGRRETAWLEERISHLRQRLSKLGTRRIAPTARQAKKVKRASVLPAAVAALAGERRAGPVISCSSRRLEGSARELVERVATRGNEGHFSLRLKGSTPSPLHNAQRPIDDKGLLA